MATTWRIERPPFLGDDWQRPEQGYSYASTPDVDLLDPANATSSNPWLVFLWIFERAKRGDFSELGRLPGLLTDHDDLDLYSAVLDLIAAAGTGSLLRSLPQYFASQYFDVRLDAYSACARSYQLEFVEPLIAAWGRHLTTEKGMIQNALSDLLEEDVDGPISRASPREQYHQLVYDTVRRVQSTTPPGALVFQGVELSLESIVTSIERLIRRPDVQQYSGTLMDLLDRFETFTGWARPRLFDDDGTALPLSIRWTLEEFRDRGNPERFERGRRYFFGHPVG